MSTDGIQKLERQKFGPVFSTNGPQFENLEIVECTFDSIVFAPNAEEVALGRRPKFVEVTATDCGIVSGDAMFMGCSLEEVSIHSFRGGELWFPNCRFRHVRFSGKLSRIWTSQGLGSMPGDWSQVVADNTRAHADTDWVVDISEGQFKSCTLRGFPPDKIRVDPERQAVVTRASLSAGPRIPERLLVGTAGYVVSEAAATPPGGMQRDCLAMVPDRHRHRETQAELVRFLHHEGLALPAWPG